MHSNSSLRLLIHRSCELAACALLSQGNQYQLIIKQKAWQETPTLVESRLYRKTQRCPPCAFARAKKTVYESMWGLCIGQKIGKKHMINQMIPNINILYVLIYSRKIFSSHLSKINPNIIFKCLMTSLRHFQFCFDLHSKWSCLSNNIAPHYNIYI